MVIIYSTFPGRKEAQKTARALLRKKLAACVVCWPVNSLYWWKGEIASGQECAMFVKTTKRNEEKARKLIEKTHSYKTPCIITINAIRVNKEYKEWLGSLLG